MPGETVLVIDDSPTILKVVQLVLTKARYRVETAADGEAGLARARATRPALILLDFVMPRMNGYQFCREMARDPALKDIPVVLMSAKGDQVGERFVKLMGIVDYITKPFAPEAVAAVVDQTLAKYAPLAHRGDPDADLAGPTLEMAAEDPGVLELDAEHADQTRKAALDRVRARIAELVAQSAPAASLGADVANPDAAGRGEPPDAVARRAVYDVLSAVDDGALAELITAAAPDLDAAGGTCLRGDLARVPVAEVLRLLGAQEQTGVLSVTRDGQRGDIYVRKGRVQQALAAGLGEEFLLGRVLVAGEHMSAGAVDAFLAARATGDTLMGAELVAQGHIGAGDLAAALDRQTREIIYEILRWQHGAFAFTRDGAQPAAVGDAALDLAIEGILMAGLRRVDDWHLIETEIDDFDLVFVRKDDAATPVGRDRLTRDELTVLELINGKNTVKDIIRRSRMGSYDVSRVLHRLSAIQLIRRRVMPVAV